MTRILAMLLAGPAKRSTKAHPGESPFSISATAMGMLPVAHKYMGILSIKMASMLKRLLSWKTENHSAGTSVVMMPAVMSPIISHLPMSAIMSTIP